MFTKGLIFGLVASSIYFFLLRLSVAKIFSLKEQKRKMAYVLFYVARLIVFAALILAFLKYNLGSPIGMLSGVFAGGVIFVLTNKFSKTKNK
ncbi:MAG: hypothetical protein M0Q46_04035 [Endomicrobiales bacterium]|nr:hypothetical protein [Endomicrobiales bacterium]